MWFCIAFTGLEVANYMVGKAAVVNVIGQSSTPLAHVFGPKIGEWFRKVESFIWVFACGCRNVFTFMGICVCVFFFFL